jgi:hypothetical protein
MFAYLLLILLLAAVYFLHHLIQPYIHQYHQATKLRAFFAQRSVRTEQDVYHLFRSMRALEREIDDRRSKLAEQKTSHSTQHESSTKPDILLGVVGSVVDGVEESEPPVFPPEWWKCTTHRVCACQAMGCRMEAERREARRRGGWVERLARTRVVVGVKD